MTQTDSNAVLIFTLVSLVVIALVFGFILYFIISYRNKQRDFLLLESQKTEIESKNEIIKQTLADLKATQNQLIQSEKLASLGELTAGIAHEIQNPLNFVTNFSEVNVDLLADINTEIDNKPPDLIYLKEIVKDLVENQEKINFHGKRASNIVKSMLEHSRQSNGIKQPTDLNQMADEYLRLSYHGLRAKNKSFNANFSQKLDPNLPLIDIVSQDIGRVLLNLCNNAFYAVWQKTKTKILNTTQNSGQAPEKPNYNPEVIISTEKIDNKAVITIADNGIGMSETTKQKIFQPFFTTKPTGEGTGLGLSLAYDIITKGHGGTIEAKSTEGIGTEIKIILPLK